MLNQEAEFYLREGNHWHHRNGAKWRDRIVGDPVLLATKSLNPISVLEIGCGNGWRLEQYRAAGSVTCYGVDPSEEAIADGKKLFPELVLEKRTATTYDCLNEYDLVIFGFCLYVCDREELMEIVASADGVTQDGGYIAIHDFDPEYSHKVPYHHVPGMFSYKMDYSKLWLANPAYRLVTKTVMPDKTAVWLLKKDMGRAWPDEWPGETL